MLPPNTTTVARLHRVDAFHCPHMSGSSSWSLLAAALAGAASLEAIRRSKVFFNAKQTSSNDCCGEWKNGELPLPSRC